MNLEQALQGRDNNFNLLRLIAAWLVLYWHSFLLKFGVDNVRFLELDPGLYWLGMPSGEFAVRVFFVISGLLVAQSYVRCDSLREYLLARALRIYPALIVAVVLMALVLGPAMTTLPLGQYFSDPSVRRFMLVDASLRPVWMEFQLPGVFASNPVPGDVNHSLWTLPWEVLMYLALAGLGLGGALRAPHVALAICAIALCLHTGDSLFKPVWMSSYLQKAADLGGYFFAGASIFLLRNRLEVGRMSLIIAVAAFTGVALWLKEYPVLKLLFVPALAWLVVNLALVPSGWLRRFNRFPDCSYGVYLYAFPIQQTLMALRPTLSLGALLGCATAGTFLAGLASSLLIERPALRLRPRSR